MRVLGIDYGEVRVGIAITDELNITAQGLETIVCNGNDKILLAKIDNIMEQYKIDTIVIGMPFHMNGDKSARVEKTEKFIHKLKCKYNKIKIETVDERLTTVQAYRTMQDLNINKKRKKELVDTISAVYILETYINKQ
jgi:putative Holliday junction resolvase